MKTLIAAVAIALSSGAAVAGHAPEEFGGEVLNSSLISESIESKGGYSVAVQDHEAFGGPALNSTLITDNIESKPSGEAFVRHNTFVDTYGSGGV